MEILKSIISKKFGKEVSAIPEHGNSLLLILSIYKIQTTSYIDSLQHQLTSNKVAVHLETYFPINTLPLRKEIFTMAMSLNRILIKEIGRHKKRIKFH